MPSTAYSQIMKEAYASAKSDVYILNTLEISHPSVTRGNEKPNLDVCFVVDTSATMGKQIDRLTDSINPILTDLATSFTNIRFGVLTYGQTADDGQPIFQQDLTDDGQTIVDLLDGLVIGGTKKPAFDAISLAVSSTSWGSTEDNMRAVFVITDEPGDTVFDENITTQGQAQVVLNASSCILHQTYRDPVVSSDKSLVELMVATGGKYADIRQTDEKFIIEAAEALRNTTTTDSGIEPYYLVQAVDNYDLPLSLGDDPTTFEAVGFNFRLPGQNDQGLQELVIEIDNVDKRISDFIQATSRYQAPVIVRYRPYLSSDLTEPQLDPPLELVLSDVRITEHKVSGRATFADIINLAFLNQNYTRRRFPSLGNT